MEIKELRIGNLIKYGVHISPILSIFNGTSGNVKSNNPYVCLPHPGEIRNLYEIEGVPITPEILLAAGFAGKSAWVDLEWESDNGASYQISIAPPTCFVVCINKHHISNVEVAELILSMPKEEANNLSLATIIREQMFLVERDIQYLHQLQNLFYSLTGEELNIQL